MASRENGNIRWAEVVWHRPYKIEAIYDMLLHIASMHRRGCIVWEIRSNGGQIRYLIGTQPQFFNQLIETMQVYGDIEFYDISPDSRIEMKVSRRIKLTHPNMQLRVDGTEATIRAGLAALSSVDEGEEATIQIILGTTIAPKQIPKNIPDPNTSWLQAIIGKVDTASSEARKSLKEKADYPNFEASIRIGISNSNVGMLSKIYSALRTAETNGCRFMSEKDRRTYINEAHIPWSFPTRLSTKELASFLLLPAGENELPGTLDCHPKMTYAPKWYRSARNTIYDRTFATTLNSVNPKRLSISPKDSLEHTIILGPTGSGKSTAMLNLIMADINAGRSVLVIDPKADLVTNILERIPESRSEDVVVIDPSDPSPVGFNPLASTDNPALVADAILAVFKELFADSWGVRSQDVLSAALLTLAETKDSSLLWLPPLLTNDQFRQNIVKDVKDQITLKPFWEQFEALRPSEREQWIAPVLNKLRQFFLRDGMRAVLGQSNPKFKLNQLFTERKIVLVPLNKGVIGAESARLLGSLIVGMTWTLALSRAEIAPEKRHLVSMYIDELQDYLSLPTDLSDALAQARGLGVGITMAHQYRAQIPYELRAGIDANARNKIVFGLNSSDAREIASMAPDLTPEDFMKLPRYEVYTNFMSDGKQTGWVRGKTIPADPSLHTAADLKANSQTKYGRAKSTVELDYLRLIEQAPGYLDINLTDEPVGRRKL